MKEITIKLENEIYTFPDEWIIENSNIIKYDSTSKIGIGIFLDTHESENHNHYHINFSYDSMHEYYSLSELYEKIFSYEKWHEMFCMNENYTPCQMYTKYNETDCKNHIDDFLKRISLRIFL